ncbi:hypothetical protein P175DRAFT_0532807 [Aspergillus ochraceoroseus IBT 24754]|uniref:AP-1 complex subunit sigma-1 n=1 Tax=Aspergillus ochraceoroseus IBT 24754 TaxID=1392256 RepID=A0A2T5LUC8_9EURO|nr:uncharacterized protein P175DRAFT_0532807 [Aspergillus ochraceoroseus IBT 24754]PTU19863.1 hypothetical protein P175DRAFT_0532807 [Aspergillus ochraceoroseus IBT 24754]
MAIHYLILLSRQGKVRLAKWFTTLSPKDKAKIIKDVTQLVLSRRTRMCNFLEYKDTKVVYRRYASLFFIAGCASTDNELITLEIVHRYVEQMDKYYGNVCELDIIFNFQKAYFILDELLLAGEMQESSKKNVLRCISQQDSLEDMEVSYHPISLDHPPPTASQTHQGGPGALDLKYTCVIIPPPLDSPPIKWFVVVLFPPHPAISCMTFLPKAPVSLCLIWSPFCTISRALPPIYVFILVEEDVVTKIM